eukprot:Ihof_evm6s310 gene=Ihof_evmTU6s310
MKQYLVPLPKPTTGRFVAESVPGSVPDLQSWDPTEIGLPADFRLTKVPGVVNVTTTDFFYPLVEEPYTQGRISCANVISDMYAVGVTEIDNMLMILAASTDIPVEFRDVVTMEMIRGFNDLASEAGTKVTGGQSVLNPWPMLGGVAQSIVMEESVLTPDGAVPGDVLVLTKPLGMQ